MDWCKRQGQPTSSLTKNAQDLATKIFHSVVQIWMKSIAMKPSTGVTHLIFIKITKSKTNQSNSGKRSRPIRSKWMLWGHFGIGELHVGKLLREFWGKVPTNPPWILHVLYFLSVHCFVTLIITITLHLTGSFAQGQISIHPLSQGGMVHRMKGVVTRCDLCPLCSASCCVHGYQPRLRKMR